MSTRPAPSTVGVGAPDLDLSPSKMRSIVEQALLTVGPGARVLAIIPDKTRDDNTDLLFPFASEILAARGAERFDALVAQGTHMPMTEGEKRAKVGLAAGSALPSFRSLAEELMVSVITVKRAYEELERDGIIYRRQGLGTFVSSAAVDRSRDAKTQRAGELLREALREATEAGLTPRDVVDLLQSIVDEEREPRHARKRH